MFENIGEKIKVLAIISTILGCVLSLVGAIICWARAAFVDFVGLAVFVGFVVLIVGCLFSWIGSFVLYGFGELITQTTNIAKGNQRMQMLTVYNDSSKSSEITKETIDNIKDEIMEDYKHDKYGDIDELDKINTPNKD